MTRFINKMYAKAMAQLMSWKEDESGMEIIQVLVLLALGLALIAVFVGFRDTIIGTVTEIINDSMDVIGG